MCYAHVPLDWIFVKNQGLFRRSHGVTNLQKEIPGMQLVHTDGEPQFLLMVVLPPLVEL
jgi:hypothetical protein